MTCDFLELSFVTESKHKQSSVSQSPLKSFDIVFTLFSQLDEDKILVETLRK